MSSTVSFRRLPAALRFAAAPRTTLSTVALPSWLGRHMTEMRRRRAERHMADALVQLGHSGLIDDFQQANERTRDVRPSVWACKLTFWLALER
jgi:hypothetical protein